MSSNSYVYYDHEACTFVEVQPQRRKMVLQSLVVLALALVFAGAGMWAVYENSSTPKEIALEHENEELRRQLSTLGEPERAITRNAERVDSLARAIENLNRSQPIRSILQSLPDSVEGTISELRDAVSSLQDALVDQPEEAVGLIMLRKEMEFLRSAYQADIDRIYNVVIGIGGILSMLMIFIAGLVFNEQFKLSGFVLRNSKEERKDVSE